MSKHTLGPWRTVLGYDNAYTIVTGKDYSLECVALIKSTPSCQANARLIAAAPDMLEALKRCVELMDNGGTWTIDDQNTARTVIAKAEGEVMP